MAIDLSLWNSDDCIKFVHQAMKTFKSIVSDDDMERVISNLRSNHVTGSIWVKFSDEDWRELISSMGLRVHIREAFKTVIKAEEKTARADSDDKAAVLLNDNVAGVRDEKLQCANAWFFRAKARLAPGKSWKDVLDSRRSHQEKCIGFTTVITFACADMFGPDLGTTSIEGYVHGDKNIRLDSLKLWLPINCPDLSELLAISFEAMVPGRNQHDQLYTKHPIIQKFLAETTTTPSDTSKRLRVDFCGSIKERAHDNLEQANTWFLRARVCLSAGQNFAEVLKGIEQRRVTSLQAATYIAYACSPESERPNTVQVEMLVHAKASKNIRRGVLVRWLADSIQVEHVEAEPIHPGRNRPFTSHETVMRFYAETAREEPLNGKRRLEVYLASGEDVVGKVRRLKGSNKAARSAEGRAAAVPPVAAAVGRGSALPPAGGSSGAYSPGGPWSGGSGGCDRSSGAPSRACAQGNRRGAGRGTRIVWHRPAYRRTGRARCWWIVRRPLEPRRGRRTETLRANC